MAQVAAIVAVAVAKVAAVDVGFKPVIGHLLDNSYSSTAMTSSTMMKLIETATTLITTLITVMNLIVSRTAPSARPCRRSGAHSGNSLRAHLKTSRPPSAPS